MISTNNINRTFAEVTCLYTCLFVAGKHVDSDSYICLQRRNSLGVMRKSPGIVSVTLCSVYILDILQKMVKHVFNFIGPKLIN